MNYPIIPIKSAEAFIVSPFNPSVIAVEGRDSELAANTFIARTSDRILFKRCRRLWGWMSVNGQGRKMRSEADYFWFGSGMHFALEDFHGLNVYGHPSVAFKAYQMATLAARKIPPNWPELEILGMGMMAYYSELYLANRDPLQTYWHEGKPQVEVNARIDLGIKSPDGRNLMYGFTLDRVMIDEYGRLWIVEYKSAKAFKIFHFDTDDQITAYCSPVSSEIMTRDGWRTYDQLVIGQEVLGHNTETGKLEWTILENVHYFKDRETVKISSKSFDFVCTPDHRWVQGNQSNAVPGKPDKIQLKPIKAGQQHHYVVMAAPLDQSTLDLTDDEAAVLGWLLTDGSHSLPDRAELTQKKYVREIQALLDRIPGSCSSTYMTADGCKRWRLPVKFRNSLWAKSGMAHNLEGWESFVLGMSLSARQAFCDAAMLGDGSTNSTFYQKPGTKHDLFRLAFFLTGKFPTKSRIGGKGNPWSEPEANTFTVGTPHKWTRTMTSTPDKTQDVWCPQTKLGTWVMKQGDQITVTGNCWCAWRMYGKPVAGVIYQQHKKSLPMMPKILSTGKISVDKRQATTHALYGKMLCEFYGDVQKAPNQNILMYNSLVQEEDEDKDRFIRRDKVERNMAQLQSFETKLMMELEDMANPDLPLYPNPTRDCEWGCPLQSACVAMDAGEDWMQYMDAYSFQATTVAEEQLKWRQFLPTYEQVNLPVGQLQYNAMMHKLQLLEQETPAAFQQESSDNLSPTESFLEELGMRDK